MQEHIYGYNRNTNLRVIALCCPCEVQDLTDIKTSILGYSKAQVEELLQNERVEYEKVLRSQKERIFSLREENRRISLELEALKQRESAIAAALVDARAKAEAIVNDTRQKLVHEEAQRKAEMANITQAAEKARAVLKQVAQEAVDAVYGMRENLEGVRKKIRLDDEEEPTKPVTVVETPRVIEVPPSPSQKAIDASPWEQYRLS